MKTPGLTLFLACLITLSACGGPGENATVPTAQPAGATNQTIGDHVVHFSAQNTDQLSAEIAKAYDIVRSKNRVMLNVSVVRADGGGSVPAAVSVKTVNLTGQSKTITMRKIEDQEAVYYIGVSPVANQETLIFDISVRPEGSQTTHSVRFQRQFYTN
jgi:hypothetical protein